MKQTKRRRRQPPPFPAEHPAGTSPFTPTPVSDGNVLAQPYPAALPEIPGPTLLQSPVLYGEKDDYTPERSDSMHTSLRQGGYWNAVRSARSPSIHMGASRPTTRTSTAPPSNYFADFPVERHPHEAYFPPQTPRSFRKASEAPPPDPELFLLQPELLKENPAMSAELAAMGNLNTEIQDPWQQRPEGREDSAQRTQRRDAPTPNFWVRRNKRLRAEGRKGLIFRGVTC